MLTLSFCVLLTSLALSLYTTGKIIYISHRKHLFDEPSENRKIHISRIPNLGGVAIFAALFFTTSVFLPNANIPHLNYLIASSVILFALGLTDDLVGANPAKKIVAQVAVALMLTLGGDIRITSLYSIFGITDVPYIASIVLSVFFILLVINAFNLIDGINCLAGTIGLIACSTFAICFWKMNEPGFMYIAIAMCGCLLGFLYYNRTPARIFMGDTGSLFLGFVIATFSIRFIELNRAGFEKPVFQSAPAVMFALLIIPIFDTLRVFLLRVMKGKSPFAADRNHIHHRLIDLHFTHMQATCILVIVNLVCLVLVFAFDTLSNQSLIFMVGGVAFVLNQASALLLNSKVSGRRLLEMENKRADYERSAKVRILHPLTQGAEIEINNAAENILS